MTVDLGQFHAQIVQQITQYQMVEPEDVLLIGVSGGIDSVVLLHVLVHLRDRFHIRLHVAHLNHQFRGAEADRDAEFVRQLCHKLDIPCTIESHNVPEYLRQEKLSPQDAARQVRYAFFETLAERLQAQKIATAHNADDQAETVLLGLIRGAGLHGLGAIRPVLRGKIIRPLLATTRAQIEAFARAQGIEWVFDSSNASRKYLRNAIRLDLLPFLTQKFNPAMISRLTSYAQLFQEDAFFIDKIAQRRYIQLRKQVEKGIDICLEDFARQEVTIQRAIVYKAYGELTGARHRLETEHARAVIHLFTHKSCGKRLNLPGRVVAVRGSIWGHFQYEILLNSLPASACVTVSRCGHTQADPQCFSSHTVSIPGQTIYGDVVVEANVFQTETPEEYIFQESFSSAVIVQHLDYDHVYAPVFIRYRSAGDAFRPLGMEGSKSLKKFFIDRKVLRNKRDNIPLLVDHRGILWIIGYTIADRVKVTSDTRRVVTFRVYPNV